MCVLTNERYKNISDGIFILSPGSCPRGGTWGAYGSKIKFCPAVCPLCYLLLNRWTKFNQIWRVSYSHEWGVQRHFFGPALWGPGEGSKCQISFNYLHTLFKKQRGYRNRLLLYVCPLCYLLINRWMKFSQIWCMGYSHKWGVQRQIFI